MIKKMIYQRKQSHHKFYLIQQAATVNSELHYLAVTLEPEEDSSVGIIRYQDHVYIESSDDIKKPIKFSFRTDIEKQKFDMAYDNYFDKRAKEIPTIKMSEKNYNEVFEKYKTIKNNFKYTELIVQKIAGLDAVDIVGKNEITPEDLEDMQQEHAQALRKDQAIKLFHQDHPFLDDVWRSPADDEYESDYEKYYDREVGFNTPLIYTKKEIGLELKRRVQLREYHKLLGHWIAVVRIQNITDDDLAFDNLLIALSDMETDDNAEKNYPYETLQKVADKIIAGQDVIWD